MAEQWSPLRYPGGKRNLYKFLLDIVQENKVGFGTYVEPFAGGAGAALQLLFEERINKIILNDKDIFVYSFWHSVLNHCEELTKKIADVEINIESYHYFKSIYTDKEYSKYSTLELGFAFFFLNRCNRSGILNAGPIGGKNQDGNYKLDARFNKSSLIERIKKIHRYRSRIRIFNLDAVDFVENYFAHLPIEDKNLFIYLDPPYYKQGKSLYRLYFSDNDHIRLSEFFKDKKFKWIISYDDAPFIRELYSEISPYFFDINYFANKTKVERELIIASNKCKIPDKYKISISNKVYYHTILKEPLIK